jgi:hypothetical protein
MPTPTMTTATTKAIRMTLLIHVGVPPHVIGRLASAYGTGMGGHAGRQSAWRGPTPPM